MNNQKGKKIFSKHEQECIAIDIDPNSTLSDRYCCVQCLINSTSSNNIKGFEEAFEYLNQVKKRFKQQKEAQNIQNLNIIQEIMKKIQSIQSSFNQKIDQIKFILSQQILFIQEELDLMQRKLLEIDIDQFLSNNHELNTRYYDLQGFQEIITEQLQQLIENINIEMCFTQLKEINSETIIFSQSLNEQSDIKIKKSQIKSQSHSFIKRINKMVFQRIIDLKLNGPANYQPIKKIQNNGQCFAMAINKEQNIMIAGCDSKINVYNFQNGQISFSNWLSGHTQIITTLLFMKNSNEFVSASADSQIAIWEMKNQKWSWKQWLKNCHSSQVNCIIMNRDESLMISCSNDGAIKFWNRNTEWLLFQTLNCHHQSVYSINLNEKESQLVSCGSQQPGYIDRCEGQIVISEQEDNNQWSVIQIIKVQDRGYRVCFISDHIIVFQPRKGDELKIYEINIVTKLFIESDGIIIDKQDDKQQFFPQKFYGNKSILIHKHGKIVNIMKRTINGDIFIQQSIKFETDKIFGMITDDCEYLILWDASTSEIQIRKQV